MLTTAELPAAVLPSSLLSSARVHSAPRACHAIDLSTPRAEQIASTTQWSLLTGFGISDLRDPSPSQILGTSSRFSRGLSWQRESP